MWLDILGKFSDPFIKVGPRVPALVLGLVFGWIIIKLLSSLLKNTFKVSRVPKALSNIVVSLTVVILWVILFSELAREVGMSSLAVKISGSLLVLGLAIANGMSALAGDIVSGVFLAKDKDFECGYKIKTNDIEGTIEKIDIRKIRLRDEKGCLHVVPNSKVDMAGWKVISRE